MPGRPPCAKGLVPRLSSVMLIDSIPFQDSGKETAQGPTVTCESAGKIVQPTLHFNADWDFRCV